MKWIEIINLRSVGKEQREVANELLQGIRESDSSIDRLSKTLEVKTYYQPLIETDFSIHICWESETLIQSRSPLALRIYSALMNMGLLDYSVWIERSGLEFSQRPDEFSRNSNHTSSKDQSIQRNKKRIGGKSMEQKRKEAGTKTEILEARLKEWGIDLERFKVRAGKATGDAKAKLEGEVEVLQAELSAGRKKLDELRKSGGAASGELKKGVEGAFILLEKAFKKAKAKFE